MLRTLRRRLILSHILPALVVIPIMGIVLIYTLETVVLLPSLSSELRGQALLVADLVVQRPVVWTSQAEAVRFVDTAADQVTARVALFDSAGHLLASSDLDGVSIEETPLDLSVLDQAPRGQPVVRTSYSRDLRADLVDVLVPIREADGRLLGVVRLTHREASIYEWFLRLRYLIVAVLTGAVLLAAALGWNLALNLDRPLSRVTRAVSRLADGQEVQPVRESGPEEIVRLARSFNILSERLRNMEQTRQHLLANLVHELARPLGAILSGLQALQRGAGDDASLREELLVSMEEEMGRLQRLVDSLSHLHEQTLGPLELAPKAIDLSEWLPRVLVPWRELAHEKGLEWEDSIPGDLPVLEADPDRVAQALGNLLSNAVKYTPRGGALSVRATVEGDAVCIEIADTGPGVESEEQERVFDSYYRGSQSSRFPQGMGLGLAIARDVAGAHGGSLRLDSSPGRGARFVLRLPLKASDSQG